MKLCELILKVGFRRQEAGGRRQEAGGRRAILMKNFTTSMKIPLDPSPRLRVPASPRLFSD
ncbi:MAG: hypothetical protein F6K41_11110 [Symploca sp. SIO3E6]|nr:hypothetical protein [Caldora sp. SIO3E6]